MSNTFLAVNFFFLNKQKNVIEKDLCITLTQLHHKIDSFFFFFLLRRKSLTLMNVNCNYGVLVVDKKINMA